MAMRALVLVLVLVLVAASSIPEERYTSPPDGVPADGTPGGDAPSMDVGAPPATSTSCVGLAATCGADATDSCCTSPEVRGGAYARSHDVAGDGLYSNDGFAATISNFRLDKYEVTVGRFRAFVDAGMGTQQHPPAANAGARPGLPGSGWDPAWNARLPADKTALAAEIRCPPSSVPQLPTWNDIPGDREAETRPMNCITWYEAMAFCVWDGGYLPTEAEWNYAATGGDQQRAYPWSSPPGSLTLDGSYASYNDSTQESVKCIGDHLPDCALTDLVDVGSKPAGDGRWGQSDLTGNVFEWTLDGYVDPYAAGACLDCAQLAPPGSSERVIRGGSFRFPLSFLRTSERGHIDPAPPFDDVGVRCARAP